MKCKTKRITGTICKILLFYCAVLSISKTIEAERAAKKRREAAAQSAQEWEFDRVYPGALRDR